jgi:hypothetical protein
LQGKLAKKNIIKALAELFDLECKLQKWRWIKLLLAARKMRGLSSILG